MRVTVVLQYKSMANICSSIRKDFGNEMTEKSISENYLNNYKYMKIICTKCNGSKMIVDKEEALFTLGMSLLFKFNDTDGKKCCPKCKGKGKIKI